MTIDEVLSKWPKYFTASELNEAIRKKRIPYVSKGRLRLLTRVAIGTYLLNQTLKSDTQEAHLKGSNSSTHRKMSGGFAMKKQHNLDSSENVLISTILNHYWVTHSDFTPSAFQSRRAGTLLMEWLADVRINPAPDASDFSLPWQQDFVKWLGLEKNHAVSTIAREMTSIAAALIMR